MATTYWEKIDDGLANDPDGLMKKIWLKYESLLHPPNVRRPLRWVNNWNLYEFTSLDVSAQPRVIVFRPGPNKTSFGSVRVVEDRPRRGILWDIFTTNELPAVGLYMGIIPAGFHCHLLVVELKILTYPD